MRKLTLLLVIAAVLGCGGCEPTPVYWHQQPQDEPGEGGGGGKEENLEGFQRVPLSSSITHVQPMTGIVIWNDNSKRTQSYVQLEFCYMKYNDVCKTKDVFDWTKVENLLNSASKAGHQAVIRFYYTYPGKSSTVPDYIKEWPGYEATKGKSEGRNTEFPDWRCEELQRFHMEFHRLFAEKYDKDPRLAFFETGFGLWAEYHIYDGPMTLGRTFPSYDFQESFLKKMDEWFVDTPWCISIDAADAKYAPFRSRTSLLNLGFGNFDDSFMCEEHDSENGNNWSFFGSKRYMKAPLGGEFSYYEDYDQEHCLDEKGIYGRKFESEVAKYHMTFIIGNDQPEYQSAKRITQAAMSMGYRFQIKDFQVKKGEAKVLIANVGVAPIYRDAYVAVGGHRGEYSLKALMPGNEAWVSVAAEDIDTSSAVTIECDHLVSGQKGIEYEADIK